MMALMIVLVPLGILLGLIARAAQRAPDRYIDLMVMLEDRHTSMTIRSREAAKAFDKGLTQGLKEDNTND